MLDERQGARLSLAMKLRELADNSSEIAIRSSLSRSYYAIFHAVDVLFDDVNHENLISKVELLDRALADRMKVIKRLRMQADYDPHMLDRVASGDIETFRFEALQRLEDARLIFKRVLQEIETRHPKV